MISKFSNKIWLIRAFFFVLAVIPIFYWQEFVEHFQVYLTGTVITGIITREWHVVLFFIVLFTLFVVPLSYRKRAKWVDYSLVGAFFVSLFIEMYGIPLTLLFASKYLFTPGVELPPNVLEFDFLGVGFGMDHAMTYGAVLMLLGMVLIVWGWWSLYQQSKANKQSTENSFAQKGLYQYSRHPQYVGFILLILGWFFGWPTIITVVFSPILIYKYLRAAWKEEGDMVRLIGSVYEEYRERIPFLI